MWLKICWGDLKSNKHDVCLETIFIDSPISTMVHTHLKVADTSIITKSTPTFRQHVLMILNYKNNMFFRIFIHYAKIVDCLYRWQLMDDKITKRYCNI